MDALAARHGWCLELSGVVPIRRSVLLSYVSADFCQSESLAGCRVEVTRRDTSGCDRRWQFVAAGREVATVRDRVRPLHSIASSPTARICGRYGLGVSVFAGPDMATQWIGFCLRVSRRHYRPVPAIGYVGLGRSHPFCSSNYEPCLSERAGRSVAVEQDCRIARRRQLRRVPAATADTNLYPTFICSDPARAA